MESKFADEWGKDTLIDSDKGSCDEDFTNEPLFCVACNKTFKSDKA